MSDPDPTAGWQAVHCEELRLTRWQLGQSSSNQNTEGNTKKDAVERKAKAHAHRNAHADGRLTFLALRSEQSAKEQVGSPMQSSTTLKV